MEIIDYNGEGKWLKDEILRRYSQYCKEQKVSEPLDLRPRELVSGEKKWIYPVMERVIEGIEKGDAACKRLGIEFIEEDSKFPFGKDFEIKHSEGTTTGCTHSRRTREGEETVGQYAPDWQCAARIQAVRQVVEESRGGKLLG